MAMPDVSVADVAPWVTRLARLGYAAKAVLYTLVGVLAFGIGRGAGGRATGSRGALVTILSAPFGRVLLALIAAGLVGYAVWRIVEGITDPDRRGSGPKGLALRASFIGRGLLHGLLGISAARVAMSGVSDEDDGQTAERWTARALDAPGGEAVLMGIGLALMGFALYQLYRGFTAKIGRRIDLTAMSPRGAKWAVVVSRFGIAARGIIFGLMGAAIFRAAQQRDASEAGGTGESLQAIAQVGRWPLMLTALGLVAYGAYELINARYRRIRID
ncbi:MAG TPA: DUF1206 domain-containing protein [Gemmatimonadales bacterium]|nr:DUF1206 domain-containing protein [Gemmatimonadales bacterium]